MDGGADVSINDTNTKTPNQATEPAEETIASVSERPTMQPTNDQETSNGQLSNTSDHSRSSESSKSSKYRTMMAKRGSTEWRGNARNKLAAGIEEGESALVHQDLEEGAFVDQPKSFEESPEPNGLQLTESGQAVDAPVTTNSKLTDIPLDVEEGHEAEAATDDSADDNKDAQENEESAKDGKEEEVREEEEPEIPIIYRDWEPKPEDDETEMEDVELGGESELEDHIGEVNLDKGAFERIRALEKKEQARRREERRVKAIICVVILILLFLVGGMIFALVDLSKKNNNNDNNNSQPTPAPTSPAQINLGATQQTFPSQASYPSQVFNQQGQTPASVLPISEPFTGHLTPFQQPTVAMGNNDKITVKFPVNMLIPEGSHVLHKVYDGPDCSGGAMDITGRDGYVETGLYSAGPVQRTQNPAERLGLFLQWERDQVQNSPLYHSPSDNLDFCVGIMIVNAQGLPEHYMETYVLTNWNEENNLLQQVHMVPITTDSS